MVCNKRLYKHQSFLIFCLQNVLKVPSYELSKKGSSGNVFVMCLDESYDEFRFNFNLKVFRNHETNHFAVNECNLSITDAPTYIRSM